MRWRALTRAWLAVIMIFCFAFSLWSAWRATLEYHFAAEELPVVFAEATEAGSTQHKPLEAIASIMLDPVAETRAEVQTAASIQRKPPEANAQLPVVSAIATSSTQQALLDAARCPTQRDGRACILYGIGTCGKPTQEAIMLAALETWAGELPRARLVIVGGSHDDYADGLASEPLTCGDGAGEFSCKEFTMLWRASGRMQRLNADWLFVLQEDKYVRTAMLASHYGKQNHQRPVVVANFGCGLTWKFMPRSQQGRLPVEANWVEPPFVCQAVFEHGSICGGNGYAINRLGLEALTRGSGDVIAFVRVAFDASPNRTNSGASDVLVSCFLYAREVPIFQVGEPPSSTIIGPADEPALLKLIEDQHRVDWFIVYHVAGGSKDARVRIIRGLHALDKVAG